MLAVQDERGGYWREVMGYNWRLDQLFPLPLSVHFWAFSIVEHMLYIFGCKWTQTTKACCIWRPDFFSLIPLTPKQKKKKNKNKVCRLQVSEINVWVMHQWLQGLFWLLQLCSSTCSLCHVHSLPFFSLLLCKSIIGQDFLSDSLIMHDLQTQYYSLCSMSQCDPEHNCKVTTYLITESAFLYYLNSFGYHYCSLIRCT